jgi:hypothetical protein
MVCPPAGGARVWYSTLLYWYRYEYRMVQYRIRVSALVDSNVSQKRHNNIDVSRESGAHRARIYWAMYCR